MMQMGIERSTPEVAKKLWNVVRIVFYVLRKGLCKSKLMFELNLMFERSKLAGEALTNLTKFHHTSAFSCRSTDIANSFASPREYEFSCSNSPQYRFHSHRRKHFPKPYRYDDVTAVQRVFETLNSEKMDASPLITLPGFGKLSPLVRQLRITDSPFPLKDEGDGQIDKAAEDFIENFYKDLKLQKKMASFGSPCNERHIRSRRNIGGRRS